MDPPITDGEGAFLDALGDRLFDVRYRLRLSQSEMGAACGLGTSTIGNLEWGLRRPRRSALWKFAEGASEVGGTLGIPEFADPHLLFDEFLALVGPAFTPDDGDDEG